eukprot:m.4569 g.4569  ORF g.4569 m.4569 type:complete len:50 (+) comp10962_c0_seq1:250-399(+)
MSCSPHCHCIRLLRQSLRENNACQIKYSDFLACKNQEHLGEETERSQIA